MRFYHFAQPERRNLAVHAGPRDLRSNAYDFRQQHEFYSLPYRIDAGGASCPGHEWCAPTYGPLLLVFARAVIAFLGARMMKYTPLWLSLELLSTFMFHTIKRIAFAALVFLLVAGSWLIIVWVWLGDLSSRLYSPLRASNRMVELLFGNFMFSDSTEVGRWQDEAVVDWVCSLARRSITCRLVFWLGDTHNSCLLTCLAAHVRFHPRRDHRDAQLLPGRGSRHVRARRQLDPRQLQQEAHCSQGEAAWWSASPLLPPCSPLMPRPPQLTMQNLLTTLFPVLRKTTDEELQQQREAEQAAQLRRSMAGLGVDDDELAMEYLEKEVVERFTFHGGAEEQQEQKQ